MTEKEFRFMGSEIVRLRNDDPGADLKAGDCGVVWGVYDFEPTLYEATFVDQNGTKTDRMFYPEEVEELPDVRQTPFPAVLDDFLRIVFGRPLQQQENRGPSQPAEGEIGK